MAVPGVDESSGSGVGESLVSAGDDAVAVSVVVESVGGAGVGGGAGGWGCWGGGVGVGGGVVVVVGRFGRGWVGF